MQTKQCLDQQNNNYTKFIREKKIIQLPSWPEEAWDWDDEGEREQKDILFQILLRKFIVFFSNFFCF